MNITHLGCFASAAKLARGMCRHVVDRFRGLRHLPRPEASDYAPSPAAGKSDPAAADLPSASGTKAAVATVEHADVACRGRVRTVIVPAARAWQRPADAARAALPAPALFCSAAASAEWTVGAHEKWELWRMIPPSSRQDVRVRAARVVPASPASVWRALTDAASLQAWWGKTEKAEMSVCEIDPRAGGRFNFGMHLPRGGARVVSGVYSGWAEPRRLVFGWSASEPAAVVDDTAVIVDLVDLKDGSTRVVITHEGLPSRAAANRYSAGWHYMLQDMSLHFARA